MRFLTAIIVMMVLGFATCIVFPWWSIALVGFITILAIPLRPLQSFFSGFIALFVLWFLLCWWISSSNNHILAQRVSLLILNISSPFLLILFTAFIGGVVTGLGALTASFVSYYKHPSHSTRQSIQ